MSYDDLSIEERIQKASEYAVILSADERPDFDLIGELKQTFSLNDEQAQQAYNLMRKNYNTEFQAAVKSKIWKTWMAVIVAGLMAVFYLVIAKEVGWGFLVIVFVFGIGAVGGLVNLAKSYVEKSGAGRDTFFLHDIKSWVTKKEYENLIGIPVFALFMLIIVFLTYSTKQRIVNLDEVREVMHLVVDGNVLKKSTSGKNSTDYFQFHFKNYLHTFEFHEKMYKYGRWRIAKSDFNNGDSLDIAISESELEELQDKEDDHTINLLNIHQRSGWLIDLPDRNEKVNKENKRGFIIVSILFVAVCIGAFLWVIYKKRKRLALKNHFT